MRARGRSHGAEDVALDRKSLHYQVPRGDEEDALPSSYAWMFVEDVRNGVVPYVSSSERAQIRLVIDGDAEQARDIVADALIRDGYSDPEYAVSEWIRLCSYDVLVYGRSFYELAYSLRTKDRGPVGFRLIHLNARHTTSRAGRIIQRVPTGARIYRGDIDASEDVQRSFKHVLEAQRAVIVHAPRTIGRDPERIVRSLERISRTSHPQFAIPSADRAVPFEFSVFKRTLDYAIAEQTRVTGWNARSLFVETETEYHYFYRMLRFEMFKIEVRDSILAALNDAISRAGTVLGFKAQLRYEGLPTLGDVADAHRHLEGGTKPFETIIDRFLKLRREAPGAP